MRSGAEGQRGKMPALRHGGVPSGHEAAGRRKAVSRRKQAACRNGQPLGHAVHNKHNVLGAVRAVAAVRLEGERNACMVGLCGGRTCACIHNSSAAHVVPPCNAGYIRCGGLCGDRAIFTVYRFCRERALVPFLRVPRDRRGYAYCLRRGNSAALS